MPHAAASTSAPSWCPASAAKHAAAIAHAIPGTDAPSIPARLPSAAAIAGLKNRPPLHSRPPRSAPASRFRNSLADPPAPNANVRPSASLQPVKPASAGTSPAASAPPSRTATPRPRPASGKARAKTLGTQTRNTAVASLSAPNPPPRPSHSAAGARYTQTTCRARSDRPQTTAWSLSDLGSGTHSAK
jgi:hypothetical protein